MQLKFKPVIMGGWPRGAGGRRFLPKFEVAKGQLHSLPWSSWLNSGYQLPCTSFRCKPRSPRSQWLQTGYYLNSQWITADSAAISKPQNHSLNKMQALCLFNLFFNGGSSRIPALYNNCQKQFLLCKWGEAKCQNIWIHFIEDIFF